MYLNCHSYFSFKYGTISPEHLLAEAQQKGIACFALTDINNTSGILDFFRQAQEYGIKPVAGVDFRNGSKQKYIGLARSQEGFCELNRFLSIHLKSGEPFPDMAPVFNEAFIIYPFPVAPASLKPGEYVGVHPRDFFRLQSSSFRNRVEKLVALFPVTFRDKRDFNSHRLLRAIDKNTLLSKLDVSEQAQTDEVMHAEAELRFLYREHPQLIENANALLSNCAIDFDFGQNKNKKIFSSGKKEDYDLLMQLCAEGMHYRYPVENEQIRERFQKEIQMIVKLGYASYFLINWDIVRYARHRNFFYVGRGSGANSVVAYLLRITDVDPIDLDLYFERFINPSRKNPPDFDIDFSSGERDEITEYIFQKHGEDHTALLATYSTFKDSAVVRELGKVFGLPKEEIDSLSEELNEEGERDKIKKTIYRYAKHLYKFPNHLSVHAGGILISEKPIYNYTATSLPPKNFPLTQFSMIEAEDVGLYKFDILAQRGLGKVKDTVEIIRQNKNLDLDIHDVKKFKEDEKVSENLQHAKLMGCFYVESPAMRMLLTKLEAKTYLDLVAASSIIRPGVASSGMMREYILRFKGRPPTYETPKPIYDILHDTYGVMVYQEDVIKVAYYFAGLTLEEADVLRRGMSGKYRARAEFKRVEEKFFTNCQERGIAGETTREVWRQIESFAGYAFSKGHSASYAVESYQCMYLKSYYPLEYMVAVINNGGGFYGLEFYVHEARMCGGRIHLPDINHSGYLTCISGDDIFLGFSLVAELERNTSKIILAGRANGKFLSLADFMKRVPVSVEQLRLLVRTGAFRFTGKSKQQLLWDIHSILGAGKKTIVHRELFEVGNRKFRLPELYHGKYDDALDEIEMLGFPLCSPFELLRDALPSSLCAGDLKNHLGEMISIVGYAVTRKSTMTKKGDAMAFGTFLDRKGEWIDTTHFPNILKQFPFTGRGCYLITGKVVEEFGFYSIDVMKMIRLDFITRDAAKNNRPEILTESS